MRGMDGRIGGQRGAGDTNSAYPEAFPSRVADSGFYNNFFFVSLPVFFLLLPNRYYYFILFCVIFCIWHVPAVRGKGIGIFYPGWEWDTR